MSREEGPSKFGPKIKRILEVTPKKRSDAWTVKARASNGRYLNESRTYSRAQAVAAADREAELLNKGRRQPLAEVHILEKP